MELSTGLSSSSCLVNRFQSISILSLTGIFYATSMMVLHWYKQWVISILALSTVTMRLRPSTHLSGNGPSPRPFSTFVEIVIYTWLNNNYTSKRDWKNPLLLSWNWRSIPRISRRRGNPLQSSGIFLLQTFIWHSLKWPDSHSKNNDQSEKSHYKEKTERGSNSI